MSKLGHAMCLSNRPEDGQALAQRLKQATATIYPPGHDYIAEAVVLVGTCLAKLNRLAEAEQALQIGIRLYTGALGAEHLSTVGAQQLLEDVRLRRSGLPD